MLLLATAVAQPPPPPFFGLQDLNGDHRVDGLDFAMFDEAYIAYRDTGTIINANADFNTDHKINYYDAMVMIEGYLIYIRTHP